MGEGTFDEAKGKAKEAVGDLTDNEDLEREGKTDQLAGKAKDTAADVVDKIKDAAGAVVDKVKELVNRSDDERPPRGEP